MTSGKEKEARPSDEKRLRVGAAAGGAQPPVMSHPDIIGSFEPEEEEEIATLELAEAMVSVGEIVSIPYQYAQANGVLITRRDTQSNRFQVAFWDGADPAALLEVRRYLACPFDVQMVSQKEFQKLLSDHYHNAAGSSEMAGALGFDAGHLDALAGDMPTAEDLLDSSDDAPAIRLINSIIADAARQGVSDIHIEPYETGLVIRMRIDGVLTERLRMPVSVAPVLVSRIKVMARLDIAERRVPQDGRISLALGGKLFDVRVSTLPNRAGERVVMRLLDKENAGIGLEHLGMSPETMKAMARALAEPNGIILVTGPTGSGKTTSLYAALKQLNDGSRNILTVEDPVEYAVEGVGQTQVNAKVGLTFAAGLRAILRQDPDIVMVGEIRDRETAEIAVQAALTGHLVLSTVHTNDAVGAITRLRDMGVEPFLLSSTIRAVFAQRLVRKLCQQCRSVVQSNGSAASLLGFDRGTAIYEAVGCDACNNTGYDGRIAVFEAVQVDTEMRKAMNSGADETIIARQAFMHRPNLAGAARALVKEGRTTAEEAIRISRQSDENG